ncbi:MAG: DUF4340 domain-containing protein [Ahniella sp.]|nr:DUF4340 domain-containing protein [Ahniella sp.]
MSKHQLNKLLIVTAVVLVAAFWATSTRSPESNEELAGKPLIDGLQKDINAVTSLRLVEAGDKAIVTLVKGESNWTVAERDHFPADVTKVREYLLKLADADLLEAKTSKKESHAKLGVEDLAEATAKGTRVELEGLKAPVKVVIGNANSLGQSGTFVRRNDEAQSWLAKGTLIPERLIGNWLAKDILDVQSSRIERFDLTKGGKTLSGFKLRTQDDKYTIENVPKGRELTSEYEGNTLAAVLASLTLEDVRKSAGNTPDPITTVAARYTTFDGVVVDVTGWMEGDKGYARFAARLDETKADAHITNAQDLAKAAYTLAKSEYDTRSAEFAKKKAEDKTLSDADAPMEPEVPAAVADAAKDKAEQLAKLKQEVDLINTRCLGWDYQLPAYKFSSMNKTLEEMLKPAT